MDISEMSGPFDMMNEMISNAAIKINLEKEAVIKERLLSFGYVIDFEEELKRRFTRFASEKKGNKEIIYFDDGSVDGLKLITFEIIYPEAPSITAENVGTYEFKLQYH